YGSRGLSLKRKKGRIRSIRSFDVAVQLIPKCMASVRKDQAFPIPAMGAGDRGRYQAKTPLNHATIERRSGFLRNKMSDDRISSRVACSDLPPPWPCLGLGHRMRDSHAFRVIRMILWSILMVRRTVCKG